MKEKGCMSEVTHVVSWISKLIALPVKGNICAVSYKKLLQKDSNHIYIWCQNNKLYKTMSRHTDILMYSFCVIWISEYVLKFLLAVE